MFEGWDNFYIIVGPSAAALIGLLFVVATLTSSLDRSYAMRGQDIYMSPVVLHLALVLALSALVSVPRIGAHPLGIAIAACALVGFLYALRSTVMLHRGRSPEPAHWSDMPWYGCGPAATDAVLIGAGAAVWAGDRTAPYLLALGMLALLLISIRNAWDLVTYLAPRQAEAEEERRTP